MIQYYLSILFLFFYFQFVFAATSATVGESMICYVCNTTLFFALFLNFFTSVAGALAERCKLGAYFLYSPLLTGFVYPLGRTLKGIIAIYAPIIYKAQYVLVLMHANTFTRASGRGWTMEI